MPRWRITTWAALIAAAVWAAIFYFVVYEYSRGIEPATIGGGIASLFYLVLLFLWLAGVAITAIVIVLIRKRRGSRS